MSPAPLIRIEDSPKIEELEAPIQFDIDRWHVVVRFNTGEPMKYGNRAVGLATGTDHELAFVVLEPTDSPGTFHIHIYLINRNPPMEIINGVVAFAA